MKEEREREEKRVKERREREEREREEEREKQRQEWEKKKEKEWKEKMNREISKLSSSYDHQIHLLQQTMKQIKENNELIQLKQENEKMKETNDVLTSAMRDQSVMVEELIDENAKVKAESAEVTKIKTTYSLNLFFLLSCVYVHV